MPPRRHHSGKQPATPQKRARTTGAGGAAAAAAGPSSKGGASAGAGEPEVLQVFVLDMEEETDAGTIVLYGCTPDRRSVMLTVAGFRYYFVVGAGAGSRAIGSSGLRSDVRGSRDDLGA